MCQSTSVVVLCVVEKEGTSELRRDCQHLLSGGFIQKLLHKLYDKIFTSICSKSMRHICVADSNLSTMDLAHGHSRVLHTISSFVSYRGSKSVSRRYIDQTVLHRASSTDAS